MNRLYRLAWLLIPLAVVAPVGFVLGQAFGSLLSGMPR